MAEKASKAMIVSWCLMIALCIFSGALCLYFFVFNRPANEQGSEMYVRVNEVLTSKTQLDTDMALGDLDSGKCNEYASSYLLKQADAEKQALGKRYKSAFMCYFVDKEIIDAFKDEIAYLGNADVQSFVKLENALDSYEESLTNMQLYLNKFVTSYDASITSEATQRDFEYMVTDFEKVKDSMHVVSSVVFDYVRDYYYGKGNAINKFASTKYFFTYALNLQSSTANRLYIVKEKGTEKLYYLYETETYWDTLVQIRRFIEVKTGKFTAQSSDANVINCMKVVVNVQDAYADFFKANCKRVYYSDINTNNASGEQQKEIVLILAKGIGLEGRLTA